MDRHDRPVGLEDLSCGLACHGRVDFLARQLRQPIKNFIRRDEPSIIVSSEARLEDLRAHLCTVAAVDVRQLATHSVVTEKEKDVADIEEGDQRRPAQTSTHRFAG